MYSNFSKNIHRVQVTIDATPTTKTNRYTMSLPHFGPIPLIDLQQLQHLSRALPPPRPPSASRVFLRSSASFRVRSAKSSSLRGGQLVSTKQMDFLWHLAALTCLLTHKMTIQSRLYLVHIISGTAGGRKFRKKKYRAYRNEALVV